jgi:hypothetical protein
MSTLFNLGARFRRMNPIYSGYAVDVTDARKQVRNRHKPSRQAKVKVAANRSS